MTPLLRQLLVNNNNNNNTKRVAVLQDGRINGKLRYLLRLQPEAERQRLLWIHGEIGLPSYAEKLDRAVILLSPHHGRPAPQTRCHPHPPLSGRTDGCPSQSPLHAPGSQPENAHVFPDRRTAAEPQWRPLRVRAACLVLVRW